MLLTPLALDMAQLLIRDRLDAAARDALVRQAQRARNPRPAQPDPTANQPDPERWIPAWSSS